MLRSYHYTHDRSMLSHLRSHGANDVTVAAAQISAVLGDVPANIEKHRRVMEAAAAAAVDVLVFPELSLTG